MGRADAGFARKAKSPGIGGIFFKTFQVLHVRKRRVVHAHSRSAGGTDDAAAGIENLAALFGAAAVQIGGQILGSEEKAGHAGRCAGHFIGVFNACCGFQQRKDFGGARGDSQFCFQRSQRLVQLVDVGRAADFGRHDSLRAKR